MAFVLFVEIVSVEGHMTTGLDLATFWTVQHDSAIADVHIIGITTTGFLHNLAPIVAVGGKEEKHVIVASGFLSWAVGGAIVSFSEVFAAELRVPSSSSLEGQLSQGNEHAVGFESAKLFTTYVVPQSDETIAGTILILVAEVDLELNGRMFAAYGKRGKALVDHIGRLEDVLVARAKIQAIANASDNGLKPGELHFDSGSGPSFAAVILNRLRVAFPTIEDV